MAAENHSRTGGNRPLTHPKSRPSNAELLFTLQFLLTQHQLVAQDLKIRNLDRHGRILLPTIDTFRTRALLYVFAFLGVYFRAI